MSAVQPSSIPHRNGKASEDIIDANGDLVKIEDGSKVASSSDEDNASSSSNNEESVDVIYLKTR